MSEHDERACTPGGRAKDGRGGRRPGAGRKPNGSFSPVQGDLVYAKRLLSTLMRDESQPILLRARCALAIATRGTAKGNGPRPADARPPVQAGPVPDVSDRIGSHETGGPNYLGSPDRPIAAT